MVNNIQDLRDISYGRHIRRGTQEYVGGVLLVVSDVVEYGHQVGACPWFVLMSAPLDMKYALPFGMFFLLFGLMLA